MVKFFEKIKTKTELVSATSKPLINNFMYFAVLLDPTTKSPFLLHAFKKMIGCMEVMEPPSSLADIDIKSRQMDREIENRMENLFMIYLKRFDNGGSSQQEASQKVIDVDDDNNFFGDFICMGGSNSDPIDNDFRTYLKENIVNYKKNSILGYWRPNAIRFPTVARMPKVYKLILLQFNSFFVGHIGDTNLKCGVRVRV
uniref:hAT-like transposase RNase-H fold domain-containing protein n=1 Tax=Lactuca sativa TaxID=4236 RepID=A0A9R1VXS2_LACSA|nr:hypothetical protein LSAT_V11C400166700 [Lactuca sativa]